MLKYVILCVLLLGAACGGSQPVPDVDPYTTGRLESVHGRYVLERTGSTVLTENLTLVSMIMDVVLLSDGRFVVVSEGTTPEVIVYDAEGRQERVLGSKGRGPFEYGSVLGVAAHAGNVVVSDGDGLKLIEYRPTGEAVREITGLPGGIDRFYFTPSGQIVMYRKDGGPDGYVGLYDPTRKGFVRFFGTRSEVHKLLMMYASSGGLAIRRDTVFYASPAEPAVHYVDLQTGAEGVIRIDDPDFSVPELEDRTYSSDEIRSIIFNVSRVRGVFALEGILVAQFEHGRWEEGRRTVLHVLEGNRQADAFLIDGALRKRLGEAARTARGNSLYFISEKENDGGDVMRVLERWELRRL